MEVTSLSSDENLESVGYNKRIDFLSLRSARMKFSPLTTLVVKRKTIRSDAG